MRAVGLKVLENKLSEYVRLVQGRGRPAQDRLDTRRFSLFPSCMLGFSMKRNDRSETPIVTATVASSPMHLAASVETGPMPFRNAKKRGVKHNKIEKCQR